MAQLLVGQFTFWGLSDEEEKQGSIYTIVQTQVLQNLLATNVAEKLALEFDPKEPEMFLQQEAYKRGQIELIQHMLDNSESFKRDAEELVAFENQ